MKQVSTLSLLTLLCATTHVHALEIPEVPCWAFCIDQTGTQHDYIAARDSCREYADLKVEDSSIADAKTKKSELLSQFAACMADKGWSVPGAKEPATKLATAPAPLPSPTEKLQDLAPAAGGTPAPKKILPREMECSYARHAAAYTSESAARAKACDLECELGRKAGKKVAACPNNDSL